MQLAVLGAPFYDRAALELLLLSVPAGLLGSWVVLRGLAFFTHAVGTAAFPGLVVAGPWGIPVTLAALGSALGFAGGVDRLGRGRARDADAATGLGLVAALATGVILASDVYHAGAGIDRLLFGSLLAIRDSDLWLAGGVAGGAVALEAALGRTWLARGFDPGVRLRGWADAALLVAVALAVVVSLAAVGALLVSALFVVPAATARLVARSVRTLRRLAVGLAAVEGLAALALADALDVAPGPALAVVAGVAFGGVALVAR